MSSSPSAIRIWTEGFESGPRIPAICAHLHALTTAGGSKKLERNAERALAAPTSKRWRRRVPSHTAMSASRVHATRNTQETYSGARRIKGLDTFSISKATLERGGVDAHRSHPYRHNRGRYRGCVCPFCEARR